jgi:hypothetical protein
MAKNTKKTGRVTIHPEFPRDHPIYSEGWTIGYSNLSGKSTRNGQTEATEETDSESLPSETREE